MRNVGPSGGAGRGPLPVCGAAEGGSSQGLLEPEPHLSLHPLLAGTPAASSAHPQGPACPHLREGAACAGGRNSGSPASPRQAEGLTPGPPASLLPPLTQGHCSGTGGAEDSTSGGGPGPGFRALSSPLRERDSAWGTKGDAPQGTFKDLYFILHKRTICQNNDSPWGFVLGAARVIFSSPTGD